MAAKKRTAKKRTTKRRTTKKRSVKRASPVAKAMKAASRATEKRIMAQWHEKTAKLNAECQLSLHRLKQTSKAAVAVKRLRIV